MNGTDLEGSYVGFLISLGLFLFAAQLQEFLDRLKKLNNDVINVWISGGNM
jgi:hypothetical protein